MDEPSLRKSRLALAGGLVVALAVGGTGFLIGRGTSPRSVEPAAAPAAVAPPAARDPASLPTPDASKPGDAVKTRADLIALAAQAADAVASGQAMPQAVADAAGQRFEIRLPFGCQGPTAAGSDAAMRWRYDETAKALRVHVAPVVWSKADLVAADDQSTTDDLVEGFWIPRPWTASEACPVAQDHSTPIGSDAVTLPGQTLAIAQIFDGNSARQGRRDGKPYETVVRVAPDALRADQGFHLRITGRIADLPGRGPISCRQPAGAEQRPICIVAVTMDDVAIDNPQTGKTLATWNVTGAGGVER